MSDERPPSAERVPTLTEVVELGEPAEPASLLIQALPVAVDAAVPEQAGMLVEQVLAELEPRLDLLFEARLREALAPALARAADSLIRDGRDSLTRVLRDLVEEAVAKATQRRRGD